MSAVLMKILQVILALSVLIVIHEAGHFTFARIFGIRVDKFFLFFDAGGFKLLSTKEGWFSKLFPSLKDKETEYGIGWLPLGGYCKIAGMIDESMDLEHLSHEPQPWEFRSKKAWQRLLVMVGGVLYNFIFAFIAYISILGIWGRTYLSNSSARIYVNDLAYEMGFRSGDRILKMDDYVPEDFGMLQADLARRSVREVTVLRGTDTLDIYIDRNTVGQILSTPGMFDIAVPFVVDSIIPGPNAGSGLAKGDKVVSIGGEEAEWFQDARALLASHSGETVDAGVLRGADSLAVSLQVDSLGRIGVILPPLEGVVKKEYSALSAIPAGIKYTFDTIGGYLDDLKMVATPKTEAYKSVGSFIAIGQVFPSTWDWFRFINLLALLSIMLGVMNLLPIPGLDGGHIVFTLYEMLTGRKPSDRFLEAAQIIGMVLLLGLMVLAFGNDIGRLIGGGF
ncbi:MAG: RIP metalloprotease RseP [Bacteroidales bacterium]|nr:RIP metalloprotease RseP [Bacteroidales bacterium]